MPLKVRDFSATIQSEGADQLRLQYKLGPDEAGYSSRDFFESVSYPADPLREAGAAAFNASILSAWTALKASPAWSTFRVAVRDAIKTRHGIA